MLLLLLPTHVNSSPIVSNIILIYSVLIDNTKLAWFYILTIITDTKRQATRYVYTHGYSRW